VRPCKCRRRAATVRCLHSRRASGIESGGPGAVRALAERFAANETDYTAPDFDETSTREQFVNGLFDALAWDVLDAEGRGRAREVVFHPRLVDAHEPAGAEEWDEGLTEDELAAREPVTRIPDYAFRFDGATRAEPCPSGLDRLSATSRGPAVRARHRPYRPKAWRR
jgi:hypothetical protein